MASTKLLWTHTTADGKKIRIEQMADEHLRNTIKLWVSRINQLKNVGDAKMSAFTREMYGLNAASQKDAGRMAAEYRNKILPYAFEALVHRPAIAADVLEELKKIEGRTGAILEIDGVQFALPEWASITDEGYDEHDYDWRNS